MFPTHVYFGRRTRDSPGRDSSGVRERLRAESEKRYSRRDSFTHTPARRLTERDQRCTPVDSYYGKLFTYMLSISTHNLPFAY